MNSNLDEALVYANKALHLSAQQTEKPFYRELLYAKSEAFSHRGQTDSCFFLLDELLQEENVIDDNLLLGDIYRLYGTGLKDIRKLNLARRKLNKSLFYYTQAKDSRKQAAVYNSISILMKSQGQFDSAAFYSIQSLRLVELSHDSIGLIKSLGSLGKIFIDLRNYDKAKAYLLEGYELVKLVGHKRYEALMLSNLGIVYFHLEQLDSALYYYQQALALEESMNNPTGIAYLNGNIGGVYDLGREYDKALNYFIKAYQIHDSLNDPQGIVGAKTNIALIYARKGLYREALQRYDTVLQLAMDYELPDDVAHTYFNIFRTYSAAGDYKKAFEYQTLYHAMNDSLYTLAKNSRIAELEMEYGKEQDQAEILVLKNRTLEQELEIKKKTNQRNIYTLAGLILAIAVLMVYLVNRQRMVKDRMVRLKEIERLNQEKKALAARALVEGQEEERKRVATELHDGIGVLLSTVKLQFTNIEEKLPENRALFERATSLLEKASGDVRRISHNLMPGNLVRFGLFDALEDLFETLDESESLEAKIDVKGNLDRLPENHEIMLYRVVQELLNNTLKHGKASSIFLLIDRQADRLNMHYADNGVGFAMEKLVDSGSLGLKSIQSRVHFLEGELNIESAPGKGASFRISIPIKFTRA